MSPLLLCQGTALALPLKDASVHTCVTSPPYFQLRDYGVTAQLGLEVTLDAYIIAIRQAFREVWRVLRDDGTLWLNLGDSYNAHPNQRSSTDKAGEKQQTNAGSVALSSRNIPTLKPKNLLGVPWRLAFALQADGWILRSEIIWAKLNPMPESVQDRPTRSHEQVFLFSKQARYFYDAEAVREPHADFQRGNARRHANYGGQRPAAFAQEKHITRWEHDESQRVYNPNGRNARTVWRIATEPFSGSHFASFPSALVRRCLLAGAPMQVCAACGAPWRREVERGESSWEARKAAGEDPRGYHVGDKTRHHAGSPYVGNQAPPGVSTGGLGWVAPRVTTGFAPTCACAAGTQPATILDPFAGSGTTLLVARELGHHAVGIDLSYSYLHDIARERLGLAALARWEGAGQAAPGVSYGDLPLFGGHGDA